MCKLRAMLLDGSSLLGKAAVTGQNRRCEKRGCSLFFPEGYYPAKLLMIQDFPITLKDFSSHGGEGSTTSLTFASSLPASLGSNTCGFASEVAGPDTVRSSFAET